MTADRIPAPRPVPTQEDRMRDARTEIDHAINLTVEAHNAAYHPGQPCSEDGDDRCAALPRRSTGTDRTFATYLDRTERDQLDARAATAEAERDEALDDRDAYKEARDVAQQLATVRQDVNDSLRQDLSDAGDVIAAVREAAERLDRALAGRLPSLPDIRAAVEHIDRALAAYDTTPESTASPALGSLPPRAQDQPDAWIVPKIAHDQNRLVGPRVHGRWIHRAAGQSDPEHARRYAAELLAAADEAEKAEG